MSALSKDDAETPTIEAVVTELAQQVDLSNITKFNDVRANLFDSAKRALNRLYIVITQFIVRVSIIQSLAMSIQDIFL